MAETTMWPPFKVGDQVTRPTDVYRQGSPLLRGTVTRCYAETGYPELYEITWTGERGKPIEPRVERGYLRHGLHPDA
jgi:hypothetical protein